MDKTNKKVFVMSGISGSGKSTRIQNYINDNGYTLTHKGYDEIDGVKYVAYRLYGNGEGYIAVFSSDYIKEQNGLTSKEDFANNTKLAHKYLKHSYKKAVTEGYDAIFVDTTGLSVRVRRYYYETAKQNNLDVTVWVNIIGLKESYKRVEARNISFAKPSIEDINTQLKALETPEIGVDCDNIEVFGSYFTKGFANKYRVDKDIKALGFNDTTNSIPKIEELLKGITADAMEYEFKHIHEEHESPWHAESIIDHINMTIDFSYSARLKTIAVFHDLGKGFTKVLKSDGYYGYFGHEKLSAVIMLDFYNQMNGKEDFTNEQLENVKVVKYHMLPFGEIGISAKTIRKHNITVDEYDLISAFNQIDRKSSIRMEIEDK